MNYFHGPKYILAISLFFCGAQYSHGSNNH
jgi:hypothetical protein